MASLLEQICMETLISVKASEKPNTFPMALEMIESILTNDDE
jgi:hypothetical protein